MKIFILMNMLIYETLLKSLAKYIPTIATCWEIHIDCLLFLQKKTPSSPTGQYPWWKSLGQLCTHMSQSTTLLFQGAAKRRVKFFFAKTKTSLNILLGDGSYDILVQQHPVDDDFLSQKSWIKKIITKCFAAANTGLFFSTRKVLQIYSRGRLKK